MNKLKADASFSVRSFDQTVLRWLKAHGMNSKTIYVAVSGGVDSVVLLEVLSKWSRLLKLELKVVHIHHGRLKRRTEAQKFVQKLAADKKLPFLTNIAMAKKSGVKSVKTVFKSEEDLRNFRWEQISQLIGADLTQVHSAGHATLAVVATAHHLDDLIETQLIRLLRGTGLQGVEGMTSVAYSSSSLRIRPLLELSRQQILAYAKRSKLKWFEDVSNSSSEPLRNWLRHKWIAPLEKKNAGLKASLARSLTMLSKAQPVVTSELAERLIDENKIELQEFLTLARDQKEAVLAYYMHKLNLRNYSKNHITEILKQLDTGRRELRFNMLKREWFINAQHIFCGPS
ncbi:MAG: tRNA lysidine(34) synthetase TilS [Bdellovibrionota bacterium]